ncbi:MAG: hypothetical protein IT581_19415 [Verrucomicrobiales bacterium]|nr:hypothetical protein [Verrucomicrobiales bacterium]
MQLSPLILPIFLLLAQVPQACAQATVVGFPFPYPLEIGESAGTMAVEIRRTGDTNRTVTVEVTSVGFTAQPGSDFEALNTKVTFAPGEVSKAVEISLLADRRLENLETFGLELRNPVGASLGTSRRDVQIRDDSTGVRFDGSDGSDVFENQPFASVNVLAPAGLTRPFTVRYRTLEDPKRPQHDYIPTAGQLTFDASHPFHTVIVPLLDDQVRDGLKNLTVVLEDPSDGQILGEPNVYSVYIRDDEGGYEAMYAALRENDPHAAVPLIRRGSYDFESSVGYRVTSSTNGDPAVAGVHFVPSQGRVTFPRGVSLVMLPVTLIDNPDSEPVRLLRVELFDADGDIPIDVPVMDYNIEDDETEQGWTHFYTLDGGGEGRRDVPLVVTEQEGLVQIFVRRPAGLSVPSSVNFSVPSDAPNSDSTAVVGLDFEPVRGTLAFAPGQTLASFSIRLHVNPQPGPDRHFEVGFSDFIGLIGNAVSSRVRIRDADVDLAHPDADFRLELDDVRDVVPAGTNGFLMAVTGSTDSFGNGRPTRLTRLLSNGAVDTMTTPWTEFTFGIDSLTACPDGGVAFCNTDGFLRRLLPTLLPDPGFSLAAVAGRRVYQVAARTGGGFFVLLDGRDVIALHPDGTRDPSFQTIFVEGMGAFVIPRPDGGLLVYGWDIDTQRVGLSAWTPQGQRDPAFRQDPRIHSFGSPSMLSNGRILVPGERQGAEYELFALTPQGRVDETFPTIPGYAQVAVDEDGFWLIRFSEEVGVHQIERRHLDGTLDATRPVERLERPWRRGIPGWLHSDTQRRLLCGALVANGHLAGGVRLDHTPPARRIDLLPDDARIGEDAGPTTVTVRRNGNAAAPLTLHWQTADGTARAGMDYLPTSGGWTFGVGERLARLSIEILDNKLADGDRSVRLQFIASDGDPIPDAVMTIVNDDAGFLPGGIQVDRAFGTLLLRPTGHLLRRGTTGGGKLTFQSALMGGVWTADGYANLGLDGDRSLLSIPLVQQPSPGIFGFFGWDTRQGNPQWGD